MLISTSLFALYTNVIIWVYGLIEYGYRLFAKYLFQHVMTWIVENRLCHVLHAKTEPNRYKNTICLVDL